MMQIDEKWLEFATDRQAEVIRTVIAEGSQAAAARKLGVRRDSVKKAIEAAKARAIRQGHSPDHDMTHTAPDGYHVKGVSTYYNKEGKPAGQWVKTSIDAERQAEFIREAIRALTDDLPRVDPVMFDGRDCSNMLAVYPLGDLHLGSRSWAQECGEDWDLGIAEEKILSVFDRLIRVAPPCKRAVIVDCGDLHHRDNMDGVTERSGHRLDVDGRYGKMANVSVRVMRRMIESALIHHERVEVICNMGNHNDTSAQWLAIALQNIYENEPRIYVHPYMKPFHYVQHGKVMIATHHGHSCKADKIPSVMATDEPIMWGSTVHRYALLGHVHHSSVKEYPGCVVETFRTLAAKDAYATWAGYRAARDSKCIIYHPEHGEVERHTVNITAVL